MTSCLLHEFVYDWRLEPLDKGEATRIWLRVAIREEEIEDLKDFSRGGLAYRSGALPPSPQTPRARP